MEIIEAAHLLGVEKRAKGRVTTKRLERAREEHWRPAVRAECPRDRPCPYVGCRYNLYLDATGAGTIKFNFMHDEIEPMEIDEVPRNCALDYADAGPMTLDEIGAAIGGITRERIRQIEADGLEKMRDRHAGRDDPERFTDERSEEEKREAAELFGEYLKSAHPLTPKLIRDMRDMIHTSGIGVSISSRDVAGGHKETHIYIYVRPRMRHPLLQRAIAVAGKTVFGPIEDGDERITLTRALTEDEFARWGRVLPVQVAQEMETFDTYEIIIHHPYSIRYTPDAVRRPFMRAFADTITRI